MTRAWGEGSIGLLCADTRHRDPRARGRSVALARGQTCASFPHVTFSGSQVPLEGGANCETSSLGKRCSEPLCQGSSVRVPDLEAGRTAPPPPRPQQRIIQTQRSVVPGLGTLDLLGL